MKGLAKEPTDEEMTPFVGEGKYEDITIGSNKYLSFISSSEIYGIPISRVKEIIEYGKVTRVPMVPSYIRGVINLRGSVVPIICLSARLGYEPEEVSKRTCIVITEVISDGEPMDIGLLVGGVNEVIDIENSNIEESPSFGVKIRADFIDGIGKDKQKFIVLLDIDTVLSVEELASLGTQQESVETE